jgi:hypothetical protein
VFSPYRPPFPVQPLYIADTAFACIGHKRRLFPAVKYCFYVQTEAAFFFTSSCQRSGIERLKCSNRFLLRAGSTFSSLPRICAASAL